MTAAVRALRISDDILGNPDEIRRRVADEGYVFFKGLQNADRLKSLRHDIMGVLMAGGWLQPGTPVDEGIANLDALCTEGDPEYTDVYHQVQRLESFHTSGHWPEVIQIMEKVIGGPVLPQPQKICRLWFPRYTQHTTPTHQDFVHFQGSYDTYTCWAPVGDCPIELGGLAVLPGSHRPEQIKPHHFALGAGLLAIHDDDLAGEWHTTDYEIGDTLIFHSLLVHRALPNLTPDRLRVSLDNRYQSIEIPVAEHMLLPHLSGIAPLEWDDVCANWQSEEFQNYWQDRDLKVVPKQEQWLEQIFDEVIALTRQGDEAGAHHLRRLVRREPESDRGLVARDVLEEAGLLEGRP